jgi:hypothetical protein
LGPANPRIADGYTPRAVGVVRLIASDLERFYFEWPGRDVTYEDVFYILDQVRESMNENYENPALEPLIRRLVKQLRTLLDGRQRESRPRWTTYEVIDEACNYLRDVVWHLLQPTPPNLSSLALFGDACTAQKASGIDLFTLT